MQASTTLVRSWRSASLAVSVTMANQNTDGDEAESLWAIRYPRRTPRHVVQETPCRTPRHQPRVTLTLKETWSTKLLFLILHKQAMSFPLPL